MKLKVVLKWGSIYEIESVDLKNEYIWFDNINLGLGQVACKVSYDNLDLLGSCLIFCNNHYYFQFFYPNKTMNYCMISIY